MDRRNTDERATPPRRRRVLILIKCMGYGGAERLVVSMMRHRDRDRFDYEVAYVLEDRDTLVPQLRERWCRRALPGSPGRSRRALDVASAHPPRRGPLRRRALAPPVCGNLWPARCVDTFPPSCARVHGAQHVGQDGAGSQGLEQGDHRPGRPVARRVGGLPAVSAAVSPTSRAGGRARDRARADPRWHAPPKRVATSSCARSSVCPTTSSSS